MIVIIDNVDSFVHNLARYVRLVSKQPTHIVPNTESLQNIRQLNPRALIVSPGPGAPQEAGVSIDAIAYFLDKIPVLGVCLGHQALNEALGGQTRRAKRPLHGQSSAIFHDGSGLFSGLASPCRVGRYHSLIVDETHLSPQLRVTARSEEHEIMALAHTHFPVFGVQFHPESILTDEGMALMAQFCHYIDSHSKH